jgi:hypothetical protein
MLHDRILSFKNKHSQSDAADFLLAIKWLGNAGSHVGRITKDDVLDGFDMLEVALDKIFVHAARTLSKKVTAVNRRKGPAKVKKNKF